MGKLELGKKMINSFDYYNNYHGHTKEHLISTLENLKELGKQSFVWLAGDSSLDNKYWIRDEMVNAINGYEQFLDPPQSVPDICYHINCLLQGTDRACIMTAIEESALNERQTELMVQDQVIQDNIGENDTLIVSVGGNDIVLKPNASTIFHLGVLLLTPISVMKSTPSFGYFVNMFKNQVEDYIQRLTSECHPKQIFVCMIYYPCTKGCGWADTSLKLMGYLWNPSRLQQMIKMIYEEATCQIENITPVPLFEILDSDNIDHYIARVEPSNEGGRLIAEYIMNLIG